MAPDEMDAFLQEPYLAIVATLGPDGFPHLTPVWHHFDGVRFMLLCEPFTVKVRNLKRDRRVSLCIPTDDKPARYVLAQGTATVSDDWNPELLREMSLRYVGAEEGEQYFERAYREISFSLVTITPSKVISRVEDG